MKWLSYGHFENFDVVAERVETQVMKVRDVPSQVLGKVGVPSRLKNPDGGAGTEAVGFDQVGPQADEVVRGEVWACLVTGGDNSMATGECFEIGGGGVERDGLLPAQIVTENNVTL